MNERALREHLDGKMFSLRYDNGIHVVDTLSTPVEERAPSADATPRPGQPLLRDALEAAADVHGLEVKHLTSKTKRFEIGRARWAYYTVARGMGYSLPVIARSVNTHHTSVMHGVRHAPLRNPKHGEMVRRAIELMQKRFPNWRMKNAET